MIDNMRHSVLQFKKDTVIKKAEPKLMRIEVEKTKRAYTIGQECGFFRVPAVLDYDETRGVAVFERLNGIRPVHSILHKTNQAQDLIQRIGLILAIIHQRLTLPNDMAIALPAELDATGTEVFLHGDFNGINVCLTVRSSEIVILDWQMTSRHGGQATYGSRYFDLIWFVNYMLWTPTLRYLLCDPVTPIAKIFLTSYFMGTEVPYDSEMLMKYANRFFEQKLPFRDKNAGWRTRYLLPRSRVLTKRFIESLKVIT